MKIAILSDIHANISAFKAVIQDVERNKCEQLFILGDLVGYYYWPKEIVQYFMQSKCSTVIRGNHEDLLIKALESEEFNEECYRKYGSGIKVCIDTLSSEELAWLASLPKSEDVNVDGLKVGLFHGSERCTNEYLYPDMPRARIEEICNDYDFIFTGHTHYPVVFSKKSMIIANPGSVGQPRDVGSLASYAILNTENKALSYHRVPFDSKSVCNKAMAIDPNHPYLHEIMKRNNQGA